MSFGNNSNYNKQVVRTAAGTGAQGIRHFDNKNFDNKNMDNPNPGNSFSISLGSLGLSTFKVTIDNSIGGGIPDDGKSGIGCNAILWDSQHDPGLMNTGEYVDPSIVAISYDSAGNQVYTLQSDASKKMVISGMNRITNYRSMLNSSDKQAFLIRSMSYFYNSAIFEQPSQHIFYNFKRNMFGFQSVNNVDPTSFVPNILQTNGLLQMDFAPYIMGGNGMIINGQSNLVTTILEGQKISLTFAISVINDSSLDPSMVKFTA